MMYGELAEKSMDYQNGHESGSVRAYDDAIAWFRKSAENKPKAKYTADEVVQILKACKDNWVDFCSTYGMGKEADEE